MDAVYAHSLRNKPRDQWETLAAHSACVGALAAEFAAPLGWQDVLRLAGQLHDIGKLSREFQDYIAGERLSGGDHSSAGARIALDFYGQELGTLLATIISAHHAGLADGEELTRRMDAAARLVPTRWQEHTGALPEPKSLTPRVPLPQGGPKGFAHSLLVRMLFSCLVDADFIATERFYADATGDRMERGGHTDLPVLRDRLRASMAALGATRAHAPPSPLNALRADILDHAVARASLPPGLFSLTVPTGGGKTLASLSFALEHAVHHGLRRVIYVIPYAGAWIETTGSCRPSRTPPTSPPMRGRGSKPGQGWCEILLVVVAPHAGAWIETLMCWPASPLTPSRPPCGGVGRNSNTVSAARGSPEGGPTSRSGHCGYGRPYSCRHHPRMCRTKSTLSAPVAALLPRRRADLPPRPLAPLNLMTQYLSGSALRAGREPPCRIRDLSPPRLVVSQLV